MEKRIRFGDLVRNSGRPQLVTLWTEPKKDRSFSQAIQKNRVLTVIQGLTTKHKDFGWIGFQKKPHAAYLLFPRPLPEDRKARVVGINYDLVQEPAVKNPVRLEDWRAPERDAPPEPVQEAFTVRIRRTATLETEIRVQAASQEAAQRQALKSLEHQSFDLDKAVVREEILSIEPRKR